MLKTSTMWAIFFVWNFSAFIPFFEVFSWDVENALSNINHYIVELFSESGSIVDENENWNS